MASSVASGGPTSGINMEYYHQRIASVLAKEGPMHLDDALTKAGVNDTFQRGPVRASFMQTLREGGANYQLTLDKKWKRSATNKRFADMIEVGKRELDYPRETQATTSLAGTIKALNGDLPAEAQEAAGRVVSTLVATAGSKLTRARTELLTEDVGTLLTVAMQYKRENDIHRQYRAMIEEQSATISLLVGRQKPA